jgi:hypothetical protein
LSEVQALIEGPRGKSFMETSVFADKSIKPNDSRLSHALGEKATLWEAIKQHTGQEYGEATEEWKFYNPKSGWTLKVLLKKRNLFFLRRWRDISGLRLCLATKPSLS